MKIYFAAPLFSLAEREFNKKLSIEIKQRIPDCEIHLPQDMLSDFVGDEKFYDGAFKDCIESIDKSDLVIAILDGPETDSGTCIEMGYAYAKNKPIIGVRTDFRNLEYKGLNLMVAKVCSEYVLSSDILSNFDTLIERIIVAYTKLCKK